MLSKTGGEEVKERKAREGGPDRVEAGGLCPETLRVV